MKPEDINLMRPDVEYVTVLAAAKFLKVTREKISRMIKAKILDTVVNPYDTRQRLIPKEQLDKIKTARNARIITEDEIE